MAAACSGAAVHAPQGWTRWVRLALGEAGLAERAAAWRGGVRGRGRQECGHLLDCDYYWDIIQRQRTLRTEGLLVRPSRRVC